MAIHFLSRSVPKTLGLASLISRSLSTARATASLSSAHSRSSLSLINRLRPLAGSIVSTGRLSPATIRCFSANATSTSLKDPNPNWSNRPPKETILLDGCDFEHWLVVMEPPEEGTSRDDIIDQYIKTLAMVVGSEEEARMKIYSVSTRCYYAFGALVSEELSYKIKELPKVRWVLPDSYLDVRNKDYGGEPFIDGQAVPYDPKYHEEWIRNNSRANERNRRNDRPRNFDKSRSFERRRENMQGRDNQGMGPPRDGPNMVRPPSNMSQPPTNRPPMPPQNNMSPPYNNVQQPGNYSQVPPSNYSQAPPGSYNQPPPTNFNQAPPNNFNQAPPNNFNQAPPNNYNQAPPNTYNQTRPSFNQGPPSNYNQAPPNNMRGPPPPPPPPRNMGGPQPVPSWSDPAQYQDNYTPERDNSSSPRGY